MGEPTLAKFGPKGEEKASVSPEFKKITKDEGLKAIRDGMSMSGEELSNLSEIHPAWIAKALENESPKIIGIILRWLPSHHVRYILEHLPKRIKMSLPNLVESFAVPTQILGLIKRGFEKKFPNIPSRNGAKIERFEDIALLKSQDLETLFRDLGLQELAMAFQHVETDGIKILLNRMSVTHARALQQRMKDIQGGDASLFRDARYTILEVALDQEDVQRLLLELGLAAFSKALANDKIFSQVQLKLDPVISHIFKRLVDQHAGLCKQAEGRRDLVMERLDILTRAGEIG
jgi:hypothetical protein